MQDPEKSVLFLMTESLHVSLFLAESHKISQKMQIKSKTKVILNSALVVCYSIVV